MYFVILHLIDAIMLQIFATSTFRIADKFSCTSLSSSQKHVQTLKRHKLKPATRTEIRTVKQELPKMLYAFSAFQQKLVMIGFIFLNGPAEKTAFDQRLQPGGGMKEASLQSEHYSAVSTSLD